MFAYSSRLGSSSPTKPRTLRGLAAALLVGLAWLIAPSAAHAKTTLRFSAAAPVIMPVGTTVHVAGDIRITGECTIGKPGDPPNCPSIPVDLLGPTVGPGFTASLHGPGGGSAGATVVVSTEEGTFFDVSLTATAPGRSTLRVASLQAGDTSITVVAIAPLCDPASVAVPLGGQATVAVPVHLPSDSDVSVEFEPHALARFAQSAHRVAPDLVELTIANTAPTGLGTISHTLDALVTATGFITPNDANDDANDETDDEPQVNTATFACPVHVTLVAPFVVAYPAMLATVARGGSVTLTGQISRHPGFAGPITATASSRTHTLPAIGVASSVSGDLVTTTVSVPPSVPRGTRIAIDVEHKSLGFTLPGTLSVVVQ